jgi:hypothetical protein
MVLNFNLFFYFIALLLKVDDMMATDAYLLEVKAKLDALKSDYVRVSFF